MEKSNKIVVYSDNNNKNLWIELEKRCNKFLKEKYNNNCENYTKEELINLCRDLISENLKLKSTMDSNLDYYDTKLNERINIINSLIDENRKLKEDKFFNKFFIYRLYVKISSFFNKTISKNETFGY